MQFSSISSNVHHTGVRSALWLPGDDLFMYLRKRHKVFLPSFHKVLPIARINPETDWQQRCNVTEKQRRMRPKNKHRDNIEFLWDKTHRRYTWGGGGGERRGLEFILRENSSVFVFERQPHRCIDPSPTFRCEPEKGLRLPPADTQNLAKWEVSAVYKRLLINHHQSWRKRSPKKEDLSPESMGQQPNGVLRARKWEKIKHCMGH